MALASLLCMVIQLYMFFNASAKISDRDIHIHQIHGTMTMKRSNRTDSRKSVRWSAVPVAPV